MKNGKRQPKHSGDDWHTILYKGNAYRTKQWNIQKRKRMEAIEWIKAVYNADKTAV